MAFDITNASAEGVEVANDASWDSVSAFTFITWFYPTTLANDDYIFEAQDAGGLCWRFLMAGTGGELQALVQRNNTNSYVQTNTGFVTADAWNYAVFTWDATNAAAVYTGDLSTLAAEATYSTDVPSTGTLDVPNSPFRIGHSALTNQSMEGRIANCMFYDSALSLAQIQAQQFSEIPLFDGCQFAHIYHDASATQADYSGNGNTGTVQSGTTDAAHVSLPSPFAFDNEVSFIAGAAPPASDSYHTSILRGVAQGVMRGAR